MSRSPIASAPANEKAHAYAQLLEEVASDGRCDPDELARLVRQFRPIRAAVRQLHEDLCEVDLLIHGKGSASPWYQRRKKEVLRSKTVLRVVVRNDDDPSPAGPAGKKAA